MRLPGIMGLIVSGILVGPHGLGLLQREGIIELLATVGLLYILFLAALEIDLNDFKQYRRKSTLFGILTFAIPYIIGLFLSRYLLGFSWHGSALLACVFSTNTPVVYPIISKLGITRNEVVAVAIGGTIITDTIVLLVLAVLTSLPVAGGALPAWANIASFLGAFAFFCFILLVVYPYIGKWFFKYIAPDGGTQYIFIMAMLLLSAVLAEALHLEPIIGAFFAGLSLNRLVPPKSVLMNRIIFIGNTIFIPFFLLGVGMIINLANLFKGYQMLLIAATVVLGAMASKWLAAWFMQKIAAYNIAQRNILFSITNARAAAAAAVVLVGAKMQWLDDNAVNGVVLLILFSCTISAMFAEHYGRQIATHTPHDMPNLNQSDERILVPISNPETAMRLLEFARLVQFPHSPDPIFALFVTIESHTAAQELAAQQRVLQNALQQLGQTNDEDIRLIARIDNNISGGILRAIYEQMASEVIIGWSKRLSTADVLFGMLAENLVSKTERMIVVVQALVPLNTLQRIVVAVPRYAELEIGFARWIRTVKTLSVETGATLSFLADADTCEKIAFVVRNIPLNAEVSYTPYAQPEADLAAIAGTLSKSDLFFAISARVQTPSHSPTTERVPRDLAQYFNDLNFALIYPEQVISLPQGGGNIYVEV